MPFSGGHHNDAIHYGCSRNQCCSGEPADSSHSAGASTRAQAPEQQPSGCQAASDCHPDPEECFRFLQACDSHLLLYR